MGLVLKSFDDVPMSDWSMPPGSDDEGPGLTVVDAEHNESAIKL